MNTDPYSSMSDAATQRFANPDAATPVSHTTDPVLDTVRLSDTAGACLDPDGVAYGELSTGREVRTASVAELDDLISAVGGDLAYLHGLRLALLEEQATDHAADEQRPPASRWWKRIGDAADLTVLEHKDLNRDTSSIRLELRDESTNSAHPISAAKFRANPGSSDAKPHYLLVAVESCTRPPFGDWMEITLDV